MFYNDTLHVHPEANITRINGKIGTVTPGPSMDCCLLEKCNKQVNVFEMELLDVFRSLTTTKDAKKSCSMRNRGSPMLSLAQA